MISAKGRAIVSIKLYAGSRDQTAENFALLDKISNFCASFKVSIFHPWICPKFSTVCSAFIVDETSFICLSIF